MPAQTARDGEHRGDHRATRAREIATTVDPRGLDPQRFLDGGDTTFAHAHSGAARIRRQTVDVGDGEAGIGNCGETSVDRERQRIDHQATPERGTSDTGEHTRCSKRSLLTGGRGVGRCRCADAIDSIGGAGRLEQREPDVLLLLEAHRHFLTDADDVRVATDDVRRESYAGVFGECHDRDHIRWFEAGKPLVLVHRESDDGAATGDDRRCPRPTAARRTDRNRRMDERAALGAALDPEPAIGPGGPEPLVRRRELREGSHGGVVASASAGRRRLQAHRNSRIVRHAGRSIDVVLAREHVDVRRAGGREAPTLHRRGSTRRPWRCRRASRARCGRSPVGRRRRRQRPRRRGGR